MKEKLNFIILCLLTMSVLTTLGLAFFLGFELIELSTESLFYWTLPMGLLGGLFYLFYFQHELSTSNIPFRTTQLRITPYLIYIMWLYILMDVGMIKTYTYSWIFNMSIGFGVFFNYFGQQWQAWLKMKQDRQPS